MVIMEEIKVHAYSNREKLYMECYESLGFHTWSRTRDSDTSNFVELTFRREGGETKTGAVLRRNCEDVLREIESIDKKANRYYLERVVLVGLIGAVCIGLSFLFLHFHIHTAFTAFLLIGLTGCTVTLALRPLFTSIGLKKYGAALPELEGQLRRLMDDAANQEGTK